MWDLPETSNLLVAFGSMLAGSAAMWGACTAYSGLSTWKKQQHGNADFELARRILKLLYQKRDAVESLRNPFISASELFTGGSEKLPEEEKLRLQLATAFQRRWDRIFECNTQLHPNLLEAEAIWGGEVKGLHEELETCERKLRVSLEMHIEEGRNNRPPFTMFGSCEEYLNNYNVVFANEDDRFGPDYLSKLHSLENYLKQKLGRRK